MPHQLNVVLIEPEIPSNTGSIGRLCLATESTLHLVGPLGFEITDSKLKRAGLDYWQYVRLIQHQNLKAFLDHIPANAPLVFFSTKAETSYFEHQFEAGSYLIFGKETAGLPQEIFQNHPNRVFRVPQYDNRVRSLNLSSAAAIVVYEAIRQLGPKA